ncbi:MAG: hypothetical protein RLZZ387_5118 [Chloroflexota bacterium]|jgi:hypothetical protein
MNSLRRAPDDTAIFIDANIFVLAGATGALAEVCQGLLTRVRQRQLKASPRRSWLPRSPTGSW